MAPQTAVPPQLPPSVEEAYRRKCVQLKNRTNEVEEANDAARLRLSRIKRQVEKLRIERAFLLEQLAKRTSTNVEDSDGSPSPPPVGQDFDLSLANNKDTTALMSDADANPRKPKEKASRTKRGHRKLETPGDAPSDAAADSLDRDDAKDEDLADATQTQEPGSPAADVPEGNDLVRLSAANPPDSRDVAKDGELPGEDEDSAVGAFNVFAASRRPVLEQKTEDGDLDIRATLLAEWSGATSEQRQIITDKFTEEGSSAKLAELVEKGDWKLPDIEERLETRKRKSPSPAPDDEDVEMKDDDAVKSEPPAEKEDGD